MIRRLGSQNLNEIAEHFEALPLEDIHFRFGFMPAPGWIREGYVSKLDPLRDVLLGVYEGDKVVGFCHVAITGAVAEIGVSVSASARGRGVGSVMLEKAREYAHSLGCEDLQVLCAADNAPMLALARKHGLKVSYHSGECVGQLELGCPNVGESCVTASVDAAALAAEAVAQAASAPVVSALRVSEGLMRVFSEHQQRRAKAFQSMFEPV